MGTIIKLAQSGIVGINEFVGAHVQSTGTAPNVPPEFLAISTAHIFTGNTAFSIKLPSPTSPADSGVKQGSVIKIKNLLDPIMPDESETALITFEANGNKVDGGTENITTKNRNDIIEFIYINADIGWALV